MRHVLYELRHVLYELRHVFYELRHVLHQLSNLFSQIVANWQVCTKFGMFKIKIQFGSF